MVFWQDAKVMYIGVHSGRIDGVNYKSRYLFRALVYFRVQPECNIFIVVFR